MRCSTAIQSYNFLCLEFAVRVFLGSSAEAAAVAELLRDPSPMVKVRPQMPAVVLAVRHKDSSIQKEWAIWNQTPA